MLTNYTSDEYIDNDFLYDAKLYDDYDSALSDFNNDDDKNLSFARPIIKSMPRKQQSPKIKKKSTNEIVIPINIEFIMFVFLFFIICLLVVCCQKISTTNRLLEKMLFKSSP